MSVKRHARLTCHELSRLFRESEIPSHFPSSWTYFLGRPFTDNQQWNFIGQFPRERDLFPKHGKWGVRGHPHNLSSEFFLPCLGNQMQQRLRRVSIIFEAALLNRCRPLLLRNKFFRQGTCVTKSAPGWVPAIWTHGHCAYGWQMAGHKAFAHKLILARPQLSVPDFGGPVVPSQRVPWHLTRHLDPICFSP